jgi:hypothetical protein
MPLAYLGRPGRYREREDPAQGERHEHPPEASRWRLGTPKPKVVTIEGYFSSPSSPLVFSQ